MITTFQWIPNVGSPITLNDLVYPLHSFEPEVDYEDKSYKKAVAHGEWESFGYMGSMRMPVEGRILGSGVSDAARSADYIAKRIALITALQPPLTTPQTLRPHGTLRITFDGLTEAADALCRIVNFRAPMVALYPANSEFFVTFKSFLPYFIGVTSQTPIQIG